MALSSSRAEAVVAACSAAGEVSKLGSLLNAATAAREDIPEPLLMLHAAACAGNAPSVYHLLARSPDISTGQGLHIAAVAGGLEQPVALVTVKGDVPFLTLLPESGADANSTFFCYRPIVLHEVKDFSNISPSHERVGIQILPRAPTSPLRQKTLDHGQIPSRRSVFYTNLGSARGMAIARRWMWAYPQENLQSMAVPGYTMFDNIVDGRWLTAQGVALRISGNIDAFQKFLSQAFANVPAGSAYIFVPNDQETQAGST